LEDVDGTDIVTIDQRGMAKWSLKFTKKLTQPRNLCHSISNGAIFSFSTRAGASVLSFGRPRHKIISKKNSIPRSRFPGIRTACPINIGVDNQLRTGRWSNQ